MITQSDLDRLPWFHDFEFPGGLYARSTDRNNAAFRAILWSFIAETLRGLDLAGQTVLDVGCWDGYFSFMAEEIGAASVLAVDDFSQNWGSEQCCLVARELKGSQVDFNPEMSVYHLAERLDQRFDTVLCLGVLYHLHAPYLALANLRHACRANGRLILETDCLRNDKRAYAEYALDRPHQTIYIPSVRLLTDMLHSCYFEVETLSYLGDHTTEDLLRRADPTDLPGLIHRNRRALRRLTSDDPGQPTGGDRRDRVIVVARPMGFKNPAHTFKPPFGLDQYDPRTATKWHARHADAPAPP